MKKKDPHEMTDREFAKFMIQLHKQKVAVPQQEPQHLDNNQVAQNQPLLNPVDLDNQNQDPNFDKNMKAATMSGISVFVREMATSFNWNKSLQEGILGANDALNQIKHGGVADNICKANFVSMVATVAAQTIQALGQNNDSDSD